MLVAESYLSFNPGLLLLHFRPGTELNLWGKIWELSLRVLRGPETSWIVHYGTLRKRLIGRDVGHAKVDGDRPESGYHKLANFLLYEPSIQP